MVVRVWVRRWRRLVRYLRIFFVDVIVVSARLTCVGLGSPTNGEEPWKRSMLIRIVEKYFCFLAKVFLKGVFLGNINREFSWKARGEWLVPGALEIILYRFLTCKT